MLNMKSSVSLLFFRNAQERKRELKRKEIARRQYSRKYFRQLIMRKTHSRGSFTVEAAALMPVLFLTLFGCLYLCFYVHNRAWLTAAAYESALTGSMEAVLPSGNVYEAADQRSKELGNTGFFGAENLSVQTSAGNDVEVTYTMDTIAAYGGFSWPVKVQGKVKITEPVKWIRRILAAADAVSLIGG